MLPDPGQLLADGLRLRREHELWKGSRWSILQAGVPITAAASSVDLSDALYALCVAYPKPGPN